MNFGRSTTVSWILHVANLFMLYMFSCYQSKAASDHINRFHIPELFFAGIGVSYLPMMSGIAGRLDGTIEDDFVV